jgi:hypothetical protein
MALSHPVTFFLDFLSALRIIDSGMVTSDFKRAYDTAKRELAELIETQEKLERKKIALRKTIDALADQCESENITIDPSREAEFLLLDSTLAEEIRAILGAHYPNWLRPLEIKTELQKLGHDLKGYSNPQATIQMVLKRMVESKDAQVTQGSDFKQMYRRPFLWQRISEQMLAYGDGAYKGGLYKGGGYKKVRK